MRSAPALNITLGFVAGYVDAIGFMALFGLFTAHITGNLVLLGAEVATPGHTLPLLKILAFPAFIAGVAMAKMIASACQKNACNARLVLYVIETVLLTIFMLVGLVATPVEDHMSRIAICAGVMGAMAMGVHSACGRLLLSDLAPTVMMTGNVTQFVIELVDLFQENGDKSARSRCAKYFWAIVAFAFGVLIAAFAYFQFGFQALVLPIILLMFLGCAEARHGGGS